MQNPKVTILVPNYKTPELAKLCLRLIRQNTDPALAKVIVIDNDSRDNSIEYLRSLKWIHLIERSHVPGEPPALSHSRALDLALEQVTTPYVLSIHTDTLMRNKDWLPFLIQQIEADRNRAGVGSWKLEKKPLWSRCIKFIERQLQKFYFQLTQQTQEKISSEHHYLRSHCALYRMDLIRKYQLTFSAEGEVAGKIMHKKLIQHGHKMLFLPSSILLQYMDHINHATTVLNPSLSRSQKSVKKGKHRIQKSLEAFQAKDILQNAALDL